MEVESDVTWWLEFCCEFLALLCLVWLPCSLQDLSLLWPIMHRWAYICLLTWFVISSSLNNIFYRALSRIGLATYFSLLLFLGHKGKDMINGLDVIHQEDFSSHFGIWLIDSHETNNNTVHFKMMKFGLNTSPIAIVNEHVLSKIFR